MTVELIDGRAISEQVLAKCTNDAHLLKQETGVIPNLVALLVGDDPASAIYVRNKTRACTSVGIDSQTINL
ncbi:bifunctional 5,10-methylene-tetrahydrofolate dehydrogenase/5,10-methylene-tetrahydrofolate cyclohydrolase, partial [Dehalococcoidia bacterium]|nr:bifunctional 5,10-methylene-tetrahydrofolate dehydrogenase/5,10-methylene-tetrahydrofolate cyclohydrolase [Dehalococcoidia bacterium]